MGSAGVRVLGRAEVKVLGRTGWRLVIGKARSHVPCTRGGFRDRAGVGRRLGIEKVPDSSDPYSRDAAKTLVLPHPPKP